MEFKVIDLKSAGFNYGIIWYASQG